MCLHTTMGNCTCIKLNSASSNGNISQSYNVRKNPKSAISNDSKSNYINNINNNNENKANMNKQQQTNHANNNNKLPNNNPSPTTPQTTNTNTNTNTATLDIDGKPPKNASIHTINAQIYNSQKQPQHKPLNNIFQRKTRQTSHQLYEYQKTAQPSTKVPDIICTDETEAKKEENTSDDSEDSEDDTDGLLPMLKLFNNSNRPPLWNKKRKYVELTSATNSDTPTSTASVHTIGRLQIPPITHLNKSVSAFEELGKKLNHLPSFQRALTSASITSLNSMRSHSFKSKLSSGSSLHSIPSFGAPSFNNLSIDSFHSAMAIHHINVTPITETPSIYNLQPLQSIKSQKSAMINPSDLVQKRVLFVSLVQLHRAYLTGIPSFILQHAIFAFGVKRIWIFPHTNDEIRQAKQSYIDYFKQNWSKQFIEIIKQKDERGHVLWIEPAQNGHVQSIWNKISEKLRKIIDLSISEEETARKRQEILTKYRQLMVKEKIEEENDTNEDCLSDNDGVVRFAADTTNSVEHQSSFETIPSPQNVTVPMARNNKQKPVKFSISQTLLKIYDSKDDAFKIGAFDTVYMTDEEEGGVHTDSSFDDNVVNEPELPSFAHHQSAKKPANIEIGFGDSNEKKMRIRVDAMPDFDGEEKEKEKEEYLPFYNKLRLSAKWWLNKYEPNRRKQAEKEKVTLAQSAKLISSTSFSQNCFALNSNINCRIKSLFNIEAAQVLKQVKCINSASDILLKPIKELFYQSNPTLIPMEYFSLHKYMESHIDLQHKFIDILSYCDKYLVDRNGNVTPSHSAHSATSQKQKMKMDAVAAEDEMTDNMENFNDDNFKMIENSLEVIEEINVDESGMVYMFSYDDEDELDDDEQQQQEMEALLNNLSFQASLNSFKPDPTLPFSGELRGKSSDSSLLLFDSIT